jgi:hypothetical protein
MARARIYQTPKTAMQSGRGNEAWVLEYAPSQHRIADPLMGWTGGTDTQSQVRLSFASSEEAVAYAAREGIAFDLEVAHPRVVRPKAYADNFKFGRAENWTH